MTVRQALVNGSAELKNSESPWLDASLLLSLVTGMTREKILASYPDPLTDSDYSSFMELIDKRSQGYPVAYITGSREFFGRDYHVREGILCPRPDTEVLIEEALQEIDRRGYSRVHDLCTGSGCIALTLALERPELDVSASDISPTVETVFAINRKALGAERVGFSLGNLLEPIDGPLDLIATNPPYLTTGETDERMEDSWKEPALALDGGDDGLDLIRIIVPDAADLLRDGGMLMIEADPRQMDSMEELMKNSGFTEIRRICDLAGDERVILGVWREI